MAEMDQPDLQEGDLVRVFFSDGRPAVQAIVSSIEPREDGGGMLNLLPDPSSAADWPTTCIPARLERATRQMVRSLSDD
jgi:hypothetical protein